MRSTNVKSFLLFALYFFACCSRFDDNSQLLISESEKLSNKLIYHASHVESFVVDHPYLPTADKRMPGGPAWFAPNEKELSLWRAAQLAAIKSEEEGRSGYIYLHSYVIEDSANILDLSDQDSRFFYSRLLSIYAKNGFDQRLSKHANIVKHYFEDNPDIDGFLIRDTVSGLQELVLRSPSTILKRAFEPVAFEIDPEYSCFSCTPRRYIIRSSKESYALLPDPTCVPGYRIKKL